MCKRTSTHRKTNIMATSMFETAPAGTPIEPTNQVRYYYRRQIYPSTPSTGENHVAGREIQWRFQASGQHAFVPQESRLCARVRVDKSIDNGATFVRGVEKSIRYATDPLARQYDQARLSINANHGMQCNDQRQRTHITFQQFSLETNKTSHKQLCFGYPN